MLFFARVIESVDRADAETGKSPTEAGTRNGKAAPHVPPFSAILYVGDFGHCGESDSLSLLKTRVLSSRRGPRAPADPPEKLNSECNYTVCIRYEDKITNERERERPGRLDGTHSISQSLSLISVSATPPRGFRCLGPSQVRGLLFRATRRTHFRARTAPSTWR